MMDANVFEDAVAICITLLDDHNSMIEEAKKKELESFVENYALAS